MKLFRHYIIALAIIAPAPAFADGSTDRLYGETLQANEASTRAYALNAGKNPPPVVHYRYGMTLDIAKVIGLTPTYGKCGIMPAQMSYVDSKGEINILEYRTSGSSCRNEN
ncbi:DUF2790 domain-containing protein [Pseudomonas aeruginosa]|uniref:DUF2790 domain-containing protein n=1 Tax=Pseudomonadota TaxID=1224 RepID=UPI0008FB64CC|nr:MULTISPECIES: DUF2790 domain-containing protein [Pseudomonadota]EKJ7647023.1 DUF2790 domain-containing protein [Pseudomonas aeruginosa]EKW6182586.1 DUF2790 domain-containing protein [Pseudomonas aeruginosa]EKW6684981.1 DUF2790 domain-containing protein [Pseudomonas aeruginosa]EKW7234391.1 DUF2790 domain-containing protein [Pseudomonas aeruginosa]EKX3798560.1 DUF2790 domain-containing protein [Pseudomonas aeruginosa]